MEPTPESSQPEGEQVLVPVPMAVPVSRSSKVSDRLISIFIIGSVVLNIALIISVVFLGLGNRTVGNKEDASSIRACQRANADRRKNIEFISEILALPAISTPQFITSAHARQQEIAVTRIKAEVRSANIQRNCVAAYQK
jgi:hypothetical protein